MERSGPQLSLGRDCALKPWLKQQWCIPPEANTDFVWRMEDVLEISPGRTTRAGRRTAYTRPTGKSWLRPVPAAGHALAAGAPRPRVRTGGDG